jgi:diguanylate cyclase (GGDEF)-like protein
MPSVETAAGALIPVRILLVEDDPRAALLLGEMLRMTWTDGLVLAHTERLADATQELLERGASCVLLDLSIPGADQPGSIEAIRRAAPDVPIVVLAERVDEEEAIRAIRAGAQDYLLKSTLYPALLHRALRHAIERNRSEVRLAHLALHDSLTGLPNRALFLDRLGVALDRSRRTNAPVAVLFVDVDNFKDINDSLGHAAGDELLRALAERLQVMLRPMDTVARFGGDEFTLLFEDLESEREVLLIAERIITATSAPARLIAGETSVTVSIGITMVSDPSIAAEAVIRDADAAMYRAKERGRSRYELFDESSSHRALERIELETALGRAVDRAEFRIFYQPKISLDGGPAVAGFEALVRWEHPDRGLLAPAEFMPLAEETGMVVGIGAYVLEHALERIVRWRRLRPDVTIAVNLSARQLEDAGFAAMLTSAMAAAHAPPGAICLEIAEHAVTRNPTVAVRALAALKALGVSIAIDDYGIGSSSLSNLKSLPVDVLKIHQSFVTGLGTRPEEASIVGAVVKLGHALGLEVIAEGVETDRQLAELRALGCDAAQGFLLGRPVPEEQVDSMLVA